MDARPLLPLEECLASVRGRTLSGPHLVQVWGGLCRPNIVGVLRVSRTVRKWKESPRGLTCEPGILSSAPPPFLPHWLPRAPAVWEFLTLVPSGRSGSRRVTAGSTFWPVAGMKEHLETGLKPHLLTRHICPDSEALPHLTSFVLTHVLQPHGSYGPSCLHSCRQIAQGSKSLHNMEICTNKPIAHVQPTHIDDNQSFADCQTL